MTRKVRIEIAFTGYWIAGTGLARGRDVDVVTHRDRDDLPALPMTQVKGQLRETAERLAAGGAGGWTADLVTDLFGPASQAEGAGGRGGALAFRGEARLAEPARAWLAAEDQKGVRAGLFRRLAATAIGDRGAAIDHSLRSVEAAVPVTLEGDVEWVGDAPPAPGWVKALDLACAATVAFGKLKADGYGRALAQVVAA